MRKTEDGHYVEEGERVYEVLWQYFNEEYSEAYPHPTTCRDVPIDCPVWKHLDNCRRASTRKNEKYRKQLDNLINRSR